MGLIGNLTKKAVDSAINAASKKINESKEKRMEEERQFLAKFPYKYMFTVQQSDTTSVDLILWEILERDSYLVSNANNEPVYIAKGTTVMGKHHFVVTNSSKQQVGKVHKALFNVPVPFEKERKTCSVEMDDSLSFEMETHISFKKREYSMSGIPFTIAADEREREFRVFQNKQSAPIIHIYKKRSNEELLSYKYIVGFNDECNQLLAIFTTIGIDLIRFSD